MRAGWRSEGLKVFGKVPRRSGGEGGLLFAYPFIHPTTCAISSCTPTQLLPSNEFLSLVVILLISNPSSILILTF
ncbi:hypothetical protein ACN38_g5913 [Penicillium nordicum]|uniref:Uncharacterized protein n=1 Tax=Penicillium nordicum TaxID=229535 RepID=A0A0M8P903_9EURO|nr:hypothetical protein ACN38_g5913 [Penicillium nordicum]